MIGLETALATCITIGGMGGEWLATLVERLTVGPHRILGPGSGIPEPRLRIGEVGDVHALRPERRVDGRRDAAALALAQHAAARREAARHGAAHHRRRPRDPSETRLACRSHRSWSPMPEVRGRLALESGATFDGMLFGAPLARRAERRGRLQHLHDRLPGGDHRSLVRGPGGGDDLPAHRQLRLSRRHRGVRPRAVPRAGGARALGRHRPCSRRAHARRGAAAQRDSGAPRRRHARADAPSPRPRHAARRDRRVLGDVGRRAGGRGAVGAVRQRRGPGRHGLDRRAVARVRGASRRHAASRRRCSPAARTR